MMARDRRRIMLTLDDCAERVAISRGASTNRQGETAGDTDEQAQ
jgi:hypothetical protein